jgi:hypothetical protein
VANPLLKALQQMASGMRMVDIGDMAAKPNVGARVQAVQRMLANATEAAPKVDGWGWKGAPKGRFSSKDVMEGLQDAREEAYLKVAARRGGDFDADSSYSDAAELIEEELQLLPRNLAPIFRQWHKGGILNDALWFRNQPTGYVDPSMIDKMAYSFQNLENADIPWEYTGKTYKAMKKLLSNDPSFRMPPTDRGITSMEAQRLSDLMRPMTDDQRDTFLAMLPEWVDSLEELAEMARTI